VLACCKLSISVFQIICEQELWWLCFLISFMERRACVSFVILTLVMKDMALWGKCGQPAITTEPAAGFLAGQTSYLLSLCPSLKLGLRLQAGVSLPVAVKSRSVLEAANALKPVPSQLRAILQH
jgi:hypothetical protein